VIRLNSSLREGLVIEQIFCKTAGLSQVLESGIKRELI